VTDEQILDVIAGDPAGGIALAMAKHGAALHGRVRAQAAEHGYGEEHISGAMSDAFNTLQVPEIRDLIRQHARGEILPWLMLFARKRLEDRDG